MALLRRTLLVAALLAALLYAISPGMREVVHGLVGALKERVESVIRRPVAVVPIGTEGPVADPEHPAEFATDRVPTTFWVAPGPDSTLTLTFDRPTRLVRAFVLNGAAGPEFNALSRARELHVVYFDSDGEVIHARDVPLEDTPDEQRVDFGGGDGATRLEITLKDSHRSPQSSAVALTDIDFFERSS